MKYEPTLIKATFLRRYKRFLADVIMPDGSEITVHCPNTGSMRNCTTPNSPCWLHNSNNPKRKYQYSLEYVTTPCGAVAGINSARANTIVKRAIIAKQIDCLSSYSAIQTEVPYGNEKSRIDVLLTHEEGLSPTYVEIKSVTLQENGQGYFPDAVTTRGQKHLRELTVLAQEGVRAILFFCVQHSTVTSVKVASHIDPEYAQLLDAAICAGVEVVAYSTRLDAHSNTLYKAIPFVL